MGALRSDRRLKPLMYTHERWPGRVVDAIVTAKRTNRIVWQNIILALGVKLIVLVLGASGMATLWEAVFADVGVTILAVLNSVQALPPNKDRGSKSISK